MSGLVGNPEDRFSDVAAHMIFCLNIVLNNLWVKSLLPLLLRNLAPSHITHSLTLAGPQDRLFWWCYSYFEIFTAYYLLVLSPLMSGDDPFADVPHVSSRNICLSSSDFDNHLLQWNVYTFLVARSSTSMYAKCHAAPKPITKFGLHREKTNNVDLDQVWHKPGCTAIGDG